jgi:hypothetical protein
MSVACQRSYSLTVATPCLDYGHTESQLVTKADGSLTLSPRNITYDATNDVFYSVRGSSSRVFAVDPVAFGQLWSLTIGAVGFEGDVLFVPETGFLYYCNRGGTPKGLYEIDVATHLQNRLLSYGGANGTGPLHVCYRPSDNSLFTCCEFGGPTCKIDQTALVITASDSSALLSMSAVLYCPLNDRIYAYGRSGTGGTAGLSCINPDTLAIEATITESQTYYKVPAYSPVSEQIYLVREAFPVFQLLVIDPVFNTVVDTINIAPYFPTTTANKTWKCYAFGCNIYVFSGSTTEYLVLKASDNSVVASGNWTQIPFFMAAGKDTTEGIAFCANVYPSPYVRITQP